MKHCEISEGSTCPMYNPAHISPDELYNKYLLSGFKYFKIEGRTWNSKEIAIVYADYLIKPEYKSYFLKTIL